jgi:hypothetical protein
MNKRFWMAVAACYVTGHVLGFLIHGVGLDATYKALAAIFRPKAEMDALMWLMFVSSALAVFAFCFIFTKGYEGRGVTEGVRYGLWVALLVGIPGAMDQFWIYPVPAELAIKWAIANVVYWVTLGTVAAAIYRPDTAKA